MYDTLKRFELKYAHLKKKGMTVKGLNLIDPKRKKHVIQITRPLIFDNRQIPKSFEGLEIKSVIQGDLPKEFNVNRTRPDWTKYEYIWAPERFEKFVDRCSAELREAFNDPDMNRQQMLSALCFGDFEAHKIKCDQMIKDGKIPAYSKN